MNRSIRGAWLCSLIPSMPSSSCSHVKSWRNLTRPWLPSINRPSLPIDGLNRPGFPLSGPLGFGPPQTAPFDAQRGTFTQLHRSRMFGYGYGAPVYGPSYAPESTYDTYYRRTTPEPAITTGTLFLDVTPATALVFVDTAYVGSVEE